MYLWMVILLMFVVPIISIVVQVLIDKNALGITPLIGRWFVFWGVGIRLVSAGLRQSLRPQFTSEEIFGISGSEPWPIVEELGFANLSMGILGVASILNRSWVVPAAIAGGLFFGFAGLRHAARRSRNRAENIAMISDLFLFCVLSGFLIATVIS